MRPSARRLSTLGALTAALALGLAAGASPAGAQGVPASFFGVIPIQQLEPADFARAKAGGIGTVRIPVIWQFVEPSADDGYDFAQLDYYVAQAAENGLDILPFVYTSPSWAVQGCTGLKCQNVPPLGTPEARSAWQDLLRDLVLRYGPGGSFFQENPGIPNRPITQWQCWNEPSSPFYFQNPNASLYAELVRLCHEAITGVDPNARILLAGLFGSPQGSPTSSAKKNVIWKYLGRFYKVPGISAFFDAVSVHPYSSEKRELKRVLNKTLQAIVKAGDAGTQILVTEIGAGSAKPKKKDVEKGRRPLIKGKKGQARLLKQQFNFLLQNRGKYNIGNVTWYSWKDPDHKIGNCKFCNTAGLFTVAGKEKPAWNALVNITGGTP
jgi:hypothetical protein